MGKEWRQIMVIAIMVLGITAVSCSSRLSEDGEMAKPDYADDYMWYRSGDAVDKRADVFYITPTCVWDWKNEQGEICHYMNVQDIKQRKAVDGSNRLAEALFGKSCRFFSPYYRQITMNSWFESADVIEKRYAEAHRDIVRAFQYYMDHFNQGRPFLLAGHSQGAKAVIELLKNSLTEEQYERMVAAYVLGFSITRSETENYPFVKPAADSLDTGVVICFNSVSHLEAISPLFQENSVCINPLNWEVGATYAPASENKGSVFFNASGTSDTLVGKVGARLDVNAHTLLIDGLDDEQYYIPSIGELFPKGNYHVQELNLYFLNLQQNIARRIEVFEE